METVEFEENLKEEMSFNETMEENMELDENFTSNSYNDLSNLPKIDGVELKGNLELSKIIDAKTQNKADISDVPTKTSQLVNDSDFIADDGYNHTDNNYTDEDKAKLAELKNYDDSKIKEELNSKANKSDIPTKTSELENNSNYIQDRSYNHTDNNFTDDNKTKLNNLSNYDDTILKSQINGVKESLINYYLKSETYSKDEVKDLINAITTISVEVVDSKPETGKANIIYFVPSENQEENNYYDEYLYVNGKWELIGSTKIDLSNYATLDYVTNQITIAKNYLENSYGVPLDLSQYNTNRKGFVVYGNLQNGKYVVKESGFIKVGKSATDSWELTKGDTLVVFDETLSLLTASYGSAYFNWVEDDKAYSGGYYTNQEDVEGLIADRTVPFIDLPNRSIIDVTTLDAGIYKLPKKKNQRLRIPIGEAKNINLYMKYTELLIKDTTDKLTYIGYEDVKIFRWNSNLNYYENIYNLSDLENKVNVSDYPAKGISFNIDLMDVEMGSYFTSTDGTYVIRNEEIGLEKGTYIQVGVGLVTIYSNDGIYYYELLDDENVTTYTIPYDISKQIESSNTELSARIKVLEDKPSDVAEKWELIDTIQTNTDTLLYSLAKVKDFKKLRVLCKRPSYVSTLTGNGFIQFSKVLYSADKENTRVLSSNMYKYVFSEILYDFSDTEFCYTYAVSTNNPLTPNNLLKSKLFRMNEKFYDDDNLYYQLNFASTALDGNLSLTVYGVRR